MTFFYLVSAIAPGHLTQTNISAYLRNNFSVVIFLTYKLSTDNKHPMKAIMKIVKLIGKRVVYMTYTVSHDGRGINRSKRYDGR